MGWPRPLKFAIPTAFALLSLQGLSEIIKNVAVLTGDRPMPEFRGGTDMAELLIAYMAPIMFTALMVFLLIGYPVAFSLAAVGMAFGLIGIELGLLTPQPVASPAGSRVRDHEERDSAGHPVFTFMGLVLERSGMAEDLLDTIGQLFGNIRGGLAFAVIFVGACWRPPPAWSPLR